MNRSDPGRRWLIPALLLLCCPAPLWAASTDSDTTSIFLILAGMLVAAKLLGEVCQRLGQPEVLGELFAGVILGPALLGLMPAGNGFAAQAIELLATCGIVLLLFDVGLEMDLRAMLRTGGAATSVAVVGVLLPFLGGYLFWQFASPGNIASSTTAIFVGATLTATSVGITARVLADLGWMQSAEARIIVGAAVIDDVIGLVILAVVAVLAQGGSVAPADALRILAVAVGFLGLAVLGGTAIMPAVSDRVGRMRSRDALVVLSIAFLFVMTALAAVAGSAMIIGAFAAGLVLASTRQHKMIAAGTHSLAAVFAPIFFVKVGAALDLSLFAPGTAGAGRALWAIVVLTLIAIVGKLAAGWAAPWNRFDRLAVGIGMIPRGEVGLIFADLGRRTGVLDPGLFGILVLVIMATTFLAPIALKLRLGRIHSVPA